MIYQKLTNLQNELKAPKNQTNKFGGYNYRSNEDILEAVKPLLAKHNLALTQSDEVVEVGGRLYVKATIKLVNIDNPEEVIESFAYAREEEFKKGMDGSQITGASSSYSRKYAMNGLFAIDDAKDSDATNIHAKKELDATKTNETDKSKDKNTVIKELNDLGYNTQQVATKLRKQPSELTIHEIQNAIDKIKENVKWLKK